MTHLSISLLGTPCFSLGPTPLTGFTSNKVRALLIYLAVEAEYPHTREALACLLWPESPESAALASLRSALSNLRHVICDQNAVPSYLLITTTTIQFNRASDSCVDTAEIVKASNSTIKNNQGAVTSEIPALSDALELYHGPFLEGFTIPDSVSFEEWASRQRVRLAQIALEGFGRLADYHEACENYYLALVYARKQLAVDVWLEEGHRRVMRLLAYLGRYTEALAQFQACQAVLASELGVEPSQETRSLYEVIRSGVHDSLRRGRHTLPASLSSFIGRKKEMADLRALLIGATARLITILGPGGIGKTRMALMTATEALDHFEHGVWLVDLAALVDPGLLAQSVLHALEIRKHEQVSDEDALVRALRERDLLLVLDNCEHMVEACARLVRLLLSGCPKLRILVTSREVLGVEGERRYPLHTLTFPDPQRLPEMNVFENYEAIQLFIERAQQVCPGFAITQTNIQSIAQICQRLEGIPLALELAAARTSLLSVEEIVAHLDDCFSVLSQNSRVGDPRHNTMQAALDWSYNQLPEPEQMLLRRLAVFSGGWTLAAAEAICAEPGSLPGDRILDRLNSLVNKSMVVAEHLPGQETHLRLLEPIRQYLVNKQAQAGEVEAVNDRHLDYYLALAVQAEPHLHTHQSLEWLNRLDREFSNLLGALNWSSGSTSPKEVAGSRISGNRLEKGLQLGTALLTFWWVRNHHLEGAVWLNHALLQQAAQQDIHSLDPNSKAIRGRALTVLYIILKDGTKWWSKIPKPLVNRSREISQEREAIFLELGEAYRRDWAIGRVVEDETDLETLLECRAIFQAVNDRLWWAECDDRLFCEVSSEEQRRFYYDELLALHREIGDKSGEGWAYQIAARRTGYHFDLDNKAIACFEAAGNYVQAAWQRAIATASAIWAGNDQEAVRHMKLLQATAQEYNDNIMWVQILRYQCFYSWNKGEYDQAASKALELLNRHVDWALSQVSAQEYNDQNTWVQTLRNQCFHAWNKGDYDQAASIALELLHRIRHEIVVPYWAVYILGRVAISRGNLSQAKMHIKNLVTLKNIAEITIDWKPKIIYMEMHVLAILASMDGKLEQAAQLFGAQAAFSEPYKDPQFDPEFWLAPRGRAEFHQTLEYLQAALDEETFEKNWKAGREWTLEQVVAFAQTLQG